MRPACVCAGLFYGINKSAQTPDFLFENFVIIKIKIGSCVVHAGASGGPGGSGGGGGDKSIRGDRDVVEEMELQNLEVKFYF